MKTLLTIFLLCPCLFAQSVNLAWNPSTSANVTNYNLYFGTNSGVYIGKIQVGTNCQATLSNMIPAKYYFAVKAQGTNAESPFSNEASWEILAPPTGAIPLILLSSVTLTNWTEFFRLQLQMPHMIMTAGTGSTNGFLPQ
jgi:hypothetical protein